MAWAPDYCTVEELGDFIVSGGIGDADDDVQLALAITAASRAIDHYTNRQFGKVDTVQTRTYYAYPDYGSGYWVVGIDDLMDDTDLVINVAGSVVGSYNLAPVNADSEGRPWTRIEFTSDSEVQPSTHPHQVDMSALWGWSAVPDAVVNACLLQASRFYTRRSAPFGVAGSPDLGSELRLLAKLDADVAVILPRYRRQRSVF